MQDHPSRPRAADRLLGYIALGLAAALSFSAVIYVTVGEDDLGECGAPAAAVGISGRACGRPVHGSGVVVAADPDPVVITAAHVLAGATHVEIIDRNGAVQRVRPLAFDVDRDIAVLAVPEIVTATARVVAADSQVGVLGLVDDLGVRDSIPYEIQRRTRAHVTDASTDLDATRLALELDTTAESGDSGAGLFATDDEIVGILWAASVQVPNRAWAVDASEVLAVLAETDMAAGEPVTLGSCAR